MKDADFLFLTALLRTRETSMLKSDKIDRMLDAQGADDAAKLLIDCGYPDMSGMNADMVEVVLQKRRADIYYELSAYEYARALLDLFRAKYDYHNAKTLVKAAGAGIDATRLLSASGRIDAAAMNEAFAADRVGDLPPPVAEAISGAAGILSRTGSPQLADIEIDKAYYAELASLVKTMKNDFIAGYISLLIDSANLRIAVRSSRTGRDGAFLQSALIPGGNVGIEQIVAAYNDGALDAFAGDRLAQAVGLGMEIMRGGSQTQFERACDDAVLLYVTDTAFISFGPAPVVAYLAKLEWEITVVRMILTGKMTGISKDVIRERLRECHV
ncbi:MAG: V-type ATPase subunit [Oscillospiraceae bacterium]|nr:V-type ATPase subunit [Oscillospiraceae bacterium]